MNRLTTMSHHLGQSEQRMKVELSGLCFRTKFRTKSFSGENADSWRLMYGSFYWKMQPKPHNYGALTTMGFKRPLVQIQSLGPNNRGSQKAPPVIWSKRFGTYTSGLLHYNHGRRAAVAASIAAAAAGSKPVTRTSFRDLKQCVLGLFSFVLITFLTV